MNFIRHPFAAVHFAPAALAVAAAAWSDGAIDRSERALLDELRAGLGLSADEVAQIESETARGET